MRCNGRLDGGTAMGSSTASSARTGDVGEGTSVGTGISVGEDTTGADCSVDPVAAEYACGAARSAAVRAGGGTTTGTSAPPSSHGDVGDGTSVGTGISVGEDGTAEPSISADSRGTAVALEGRPLGTATPSCSGAGEVGDGTSVGTGISVGEEGARAEAMSAEAMAAEYSAERATGTGARPPGGAAIPSRSGAGEVGEGTAVGTGISVGDEGAGAEPSISADSMAAEGWPGAARGGRATGTAMPSGSGAGEVGDGTSVGTGISVGEEGAGADAAISADSMAAENCAGGPWGGSAIGPPSTSPSPPGEVGDGTSVGTGISVGEEGTCTPSCAGRRGSGAVACLSARSVGTSTPVVGTSNPPSAAPGDVGEGTAVGTGISVGEEVAGAEPASSAEEGAGIAPGAARPGLLVC